MTSSQWDAKDPTLLVLHALLVCRAERGTLSFYSTVDGTFNCVQQSLSSGTQDAPNKHQGERLLVIPDNDISPSIIPSREQI